MCTHPYLFPIKVNKSPSLLYIRFNNIFVCPPSNYVDNTDILLLTDKLIFLVLLVDHISTNFLKLCVNCYNKNVYRDLGNYPRSKFDGLNCLDISQSHLIKFNDH